MGAKWGQVVGSQAGEVVVCCQGDGDNPNVGAADFPGLDADVGDVVV